MQKVRNESYAHKVYCDAPRFATTGLNREELIFRIGKFIRPEVVSRCRDENAVSFEAAKRRYSSNIIIANVKRGRIIVAENGNYVIIL